MLDKEAAKRLVEEYVNATYADQDDELVVLEELTLEKVYGWVFFYESKRWLETQTFSDRVFGNVPILVEKDSGNLCLFGSALPIEEYLKEYETTRI